jgi:hypothetical protein
MRLAFALGRKAIGRSKDADKAVKAIRASLEDTLPKVLRKMYGAGGEAAVGALRTAGDFEGHPFRGNQYTGGMASYSEDPSVPRAQRDKVRKAIAFFEQERHPHAAKVHLFVAPKGKGSTDNPHGYTKRNIKIEGGKPVRNESGDLVYTGRYSIYISSRRESAEEIAGTIAHEFEHVSQWERGEEPDEVGAVTTGHLARRKFRGLGELRTAKRSEKRVGPIAFVFDAASEAAISWADRHAAELIDNISETTRQAISDAVAEHLEEGTDPYADILEAVGDPERARKIARHETMLAVSEGQREAWRQAVDEGLLTGSEKPTWIVTGDDKVCPVCDGLDGKTRKLDGQYKTSEGEFDGPPAHVGCRCTEGLT